MEDMFDEIDREERGERRKFYKQADTAYQLASFKIIGDLFYKDGGLILILIVLFAPLLLIMYIVYYIAYKVRDYIHKKNWEKEKSSY